MAPETFVNNNISNINKYCRLAVYLSLLGLFFIGSAAWH